MLVSILSVSRMLHEKKTVHKRKTGTDTVREQDTSTGTITERLHTKREAECDKQRDRERVAVHCS